MVLKSQKHGVRTGQTVRGRESDTSFRHQYRQAIMLRYTDNFPAEEDPKPFLGDLDIPAAIEHSLNKKKRWLIPTIIREAIVDLSEQPRTGDYSVQLEEYAKLQFGDTACFGLYSTSGLQRKPKSPRRRSRSRSREKHRFMNVASFKKPRTVDTESDGEDEPEEQRIMRYVVLYPAESSSYAGNNSKFVGNEKWDDRFYYHILTKRAIFKRSAAGQVRDCLAAMNDDISDSDEDHSFQWEANNHATSRPHSQTSLADFLQPSTRRKDKLLQRNRRKKKRSKAEYESCNKDNKSRVHFVQREEENISPKRTTDSVSVSTPRTQKAKSFQVILPKEEVSRQTLKKRHGAMYIHCQCAPRKFIIDISEDVANLAKESGRRGEHTKHVSYLVFANEMANEQNGFRNDVYRVSLNMDCGNPVYGLQIDAFQNSMDYTTVDNIIHIALRCAKCFLGESLPSAPAKAASLVSNTLYDCGVEHKSHSYVPEAKYVLSAMLRETVTQHATVDADLETVGPFQDSFHAVTQDRHQMADVYCNICYEAADGKTAATSLLACNHWFCGECWQEYLESRIKAGVTDLLCPEYECDSTVDVGTLMSLVNTDAIVQYARHCHDRRVELSVDTKWCPNPQCGGVLKVEYPGDRTVRCRCGTRFCFRCLNDAHWPAPCAAQMAYRKKLLDNGEASIHSLPSGEPSTVRGKKCPNCHRFMVKDGGCPFMSCVCGKSFCWGCRKPWQNNHHTSDCYKNGSKDEFQAEAVVLQPVSRDRIKRRQKWYSMALQHRMMRHGTHIQVLTKRLPQLKRKLQGYVAKAEMRGVRVDIDSGELNRTFVRETEKIPALLKRMVALYEHFHDLLEHSSVRLGAESLTGEDRAASCHVMNKMTAQCSFICDLLMSGASRRPQQVVSELTRMHKQCIHTVKTLVNIFTV